MEDKWAEFQDDAYTLENLGRPASFLIPSHKLRMETGEVTVEERLHRFLTSNFGAFTTSTLPTVGFWRDGKTRMVYDECRHYEVSFAGKEKIPLLLRELAAICRIIGEDCLYVKAGQYTCLLYPKAAA